MLFISLSKELFYQCWREKTLQIHSCCQSSSLVFEEAIVATLFDHHTLNSIVLALEILPSLLIRCVSVIVWSLWRALRFLCWCWEEEDTLSGTLLAAGESDWPTGCHDYQDSVVPPVLSSCLRTFETSLLLEESISDELPYSGELTPSSLSFHLM